LKRLLLLPLLDFHNDSYKIEGSFIMEDVTWDCSVFTIL